MLESDQMNENQMQNIIGDHVSGLTGVGGEAEDDDGLEQQPQRAGHAPAGQATQTKPNHSDQTKQNPQNQNQL